MVNFGTEISETLAKVIYQGYIRRYCPIGRIKVTWNQLLTSGIVFYGILAILALLLLYFLIVASHLE